MIQEKDFKCAAFSSDFTYIIDADGNKANLNDPQVVHVWPFTGNAAPFIKSIFEKQGWRVRLCKPITSEILHQAKKLCSGRECLSFNSLVGLYYDDMITNSKEDDLTIYWGVEQEGPCQCGAWPDVFKLFSSRLNKRNNIYSVNVNMKNNSFGQGDNFGANILIATVLGDLFDEAEVVLKCLAVNIDEALKIFQEEVEKVVPAIHLGTKQLITSLKVWSDNVAKIPLKSVLNEIPKVLVFGGGVMGLLREPLIEYYAGQGVIPKIVDGHEFSLLLISESVRRYGFKKGYDNLKQQMSIGMLLLESLNSKRNKREHNTAFKSQFTLRIADFMIRRFRKAVEKSGLIFDKHISFKSILEEGHILLNANIFYEADVAVGRYLRSIKEDVFDGLVHVAAFNCQPSINAQSTIVALSHQYDIPYAGLELEGPWLSPNHRRLLENVAVQAKRMRAQKVSRKSSDTARQSIAVQNESIGL